MKHTLSTGLVAAAILALLASGTPVARAQAGGPYELTWTTTDAGGGALSGGAYSLVSTIGQPEAGPSASGGGYSLTGGVWGGPGAASPPLGGRRVFLPLIMR